MWGFEPVWARRLSQSWPEVGDQMHIGASSKEGMMCYDSHGVKEWPYGIENASKEHYGNFVTVVHSLLSDHCVSV